MVQCENVQWPAQIRLRVKGGDGCNWAGVQVLSLSGGVDVFGLGQAGQLILVAGQAAEEDGTADAEDGGAPAEAVGPGVVVVALEDQLVEFDGVDDQRDDLENHCRGRERERWKRLEHTKTHSKKHHHTVSGSQKTVHKCRKQNNCAVSHAAGWTNPPH